MDFKATVRLIRASYQDSEIMRLSKEFKAIALITAFSIPMMITIVYELNRLGESFWVYEKSPIDKSHLLTLEEFKEKSRSK
ncbi:hypothetical protein IX95_07125 [Vibrio sp. B183]|uniref:hypothetical protein n=1 Tax=Vibrio sp. B183 TaxID=1526762 RepID=UPI000507F4D3|nr:hypothetical protein [Vibrio sp. B183]KFI12719.1 hypothetical protein IX95_07125 [Vibrio sp. B183]